MTDTLPKIITVKVSDLLPPEKNPNVMEDTTFAALITAIKTVGFLQPICARSNNDGTYTIVDGFHRTEAAKEIGMVEIPCVLVEADDDLATAIQIGMNRMRGELNLAKVGAALEDLISEGWGLTELEITGFDTKEIEMLLESVRSDGEELMSAQLPTSEPEPPQSDQVPKPFIIELEFAEKKQLTKVKRALKKAAGSGDLGVGLLRILGEEV